MFFSFPLSFVRNKLFYSRNCNNNFLGPLLEKALVKLHFDGDYRLAEGIDPIDVFASFSNAFYERINNGDSVNILDTIHSGKKNNFLMTVSFIATLPKYKILDQHVYTLIDKTKDAVKLYNPHGYFVMVPTNVLVENFKRFSVSYVENDSFKLHKSEFLETWSLESYKSWHLNVSYDLFVAEDNTEVLVNILYEIRGEVTGSVYVHQCSDEKTEDEPKLMSDYSVCSKNKSFRLLLHRGSYKIVFEQEMTFKGNTYYKNMEKSKYEYLFRFASTKRFAVKKDQTESKKDKNEPFIVMR